MNRDQAARCPAAFADPGTPEGAVECVWTVPFAMSEFEAGLRVTCDAAPRHAECVCSVALCVGGACGCPGM
eukprot:11659874-Alexandrium_andersonii.AAC.1